MADLGRRRFIAGAGLAAGLVGGCRSSKDAYAPHKPEVPRAPGVRPGTERYVLSTCGLCDAGCGIRVRVVDGRAVKIEGNPESPVNRGGLCARGLAGLQLLYHPDRVPGPMRRRGERGAGHWEAISWEAAIEDLSARLGKLCQASKAPGVVLIDGESWGTTHALWRRFMGALSSPNHVSHGATGRAAVSETLRAMTGTAGIPGYGFEGAGCVLLIGTGALESSPQAIHLARAMAGTARPRLVCVSPRLPGTAALVDEWLAVEPGRASALLLGLLHVLFRDQLADESSIEKATGMAELRAAVMTSYAPAQAAALAGVPATRIEALARELAASRPSVAVVDEETNDRAATAAALVLNTVLSSVGVAGGMLLEADEALVFGAVDPSVYLAASVIDGRPGPYGSRMLAVPDAILSGQPYPAEVLLLYFSNPVFSKPGGDKWARAIAKVPFVVSFSPILDESTRWADLVLPDQTYLESWDVVFPARATGVVSLRQPVVLSATKAMQTGEVVLRLATALGGKVAEALPWKAHRDAAVAHLESLAAETDAVLDELGEKGVCKLVRKSTAVTGSLVDVRPALPTPTPTLGDPVQYSFVLWPFRDRGYAEGGLRHLPWLAELPGAASDPWPGYVEISAEDAARLLIEDGDWLALTSPVGRVELRARIHPQIRPGVLGLRLGGWGKDVGDLDGLPIRLLGDAVDAAGNWLAWATRAKVEKLT
jgi:menaquinone reductase, molybdopterin-binding-like subunit